MIPKPTNKVKKVKGYAIMVCEDISRLKGNSKGKKLKAGSILMAFEESIAAPELKKYQALYDTDILKVIA